MQKHISWIRVKDVTRTIKTFLSDSSKKTLSAKLYLVNYLEDDVSFTIIMYIFIFHIIFNISKLWKKSDFCEIFIEFLFAKLIIFIKY